MTVLIIPPNGEPYAGEVGEDVADLQDLVGGYIETVVPMMLYYLSDNFAFSIASHPFSVSEYSSYNFSFSSFSGSSFVPKSGKLTFAIYRIR